MTPRHSNTLILVTTALLSGPALADVSEFSSYDECILESLKGVSSDVAANAIIASCRSTFPEAAPLAAEPAEPAPEPEPETVRPEEAAAAAAAATVAATTVPAEPAESRELTKEELSNLKATLFGFTTNYKITFENFNDAITITEVTIAVWDDLDPRGLKEYTETMRIPPQEMAKVTYEVIYMGDDQGWRWKIVSAKGTPLVY
jgi:hypothetical protein